MKQRNNRKAFPAKLILIILLSSSLSAFGQKTVVVDSSLPNYRIVIPGAEYKRSGFYQFFWGKHYRKEWTTPVSVPVINLDTIKGGLKAVEQGGGRQSKTLRLQDKNGKQYVLRSVDKDYGGALPEIALGTFIEDLAKDQVSTAHPFAAVTIPIMIDAAGVFHTNPQIVYVPYTPSLGKYNETFAGLLCLFEERPDEDQSDAPNFGYSEDVKGTEKMYEKIRSENDHRVDQKAFVKARLFDMFMGDWGRHDDQWRWAEFDTADYKIYKPVPRDRDQAYTMFDGFLLKQILGIEELETLQTFEGRIKNVKKYNFPARYIDRQLTNEVPKQTWIDIAKELQQKLTDNTIELSVKQMPPEMFSISGNEIIRKLKSRRDLLDKYAEKYYRFINKEVELVGTTEDEYFEIKKLNDKETQINLYDLNKEGEPKKHPFYSRTFTSDETHEVRLYGLGGNDIYKIEGSDNGTKIRIIGGRDKDSLVNESGTRIRYYDNPGNFVSGNVRKHLSNDSSVNEYNYKAFKYNVGHTIKSPFYANTRGIFVQGGYTYTKQGWRKEPFSWSQTLRFVYSFTNKSFGGDYTGIFNQVIGKWNLLLNASYDQVLKNYFFGLGNESPNTKEVSYYTLHTADGNGSIGLNRIFAKHNSITISGFYQSVKVKNETSHFPIEALYPNDGTVFDRKNFAGGMISYAYYNVNDDVVPTKGFGFSLNGSHTKNLTQTDRSFQRYWTTLGFYLPLSKTISIASRNGLFTVEGEPEFYQYNWLGGGQNLRGFHRQRFYGKTSFYNDNELRWIPDVNAYIFKGKIGLIGFVDNGRVWMPNENSNEWHLGYGGGLLISPFNKLSATIYYGISEDDRLIHIRLGRFF